jgi:hypothetical protein
MCCFCDFGRASWETYTLCAVKYGGGYRRSRSRRCVERAWTASRGPTTIESRLAAAKTLTMVTWPSTPRRDSWRHDSVVATPSIVDWTEASSLSLRSRFECGGLFSVERMPFASPFVWPQRNYHSSSCWQWHWLLLGFDAPPAVAVAQ